MDWHKVKSLDGDHKIIDQDGDHKIKDQDGEDLRNLNIQRKVTLLGKRMTTVAGELRHFNPRLRRMRRGFHSHQTLHSRRNKVFSRRSLMIRHMVHKF